MIKIVDAACSNLRDLSEKMTVNYGWEQFSL